MEDLTPDHFDIVDKAAVSDYKFLGQSKTAAEGKFVQILRANTIPDNVIQSILENTKILLSLSVEEFCNSVESELQKKIGIKLSDHVNIFKTLEECCTTFSNLQTKRKQNSYFKKKSSFVEPKRIELGSRIVRDNQVKFGENRNSKLHFDEMTYVSVIDTIKVLFSNEEYTKFFNIDDVGNENVFCSFIGWFCH